jgi:hypothetical protein
MEEPAAVSRLPLPKTVSVPDNPAEMSLTPREMRELKATSGLRLDYLFGDESDLDEKTQMMVWLQLRRQGHDASWEDAADVQPVPATEEPDPTNGDPSKPSPPSAATGE